jgi:hypothetical protein
MLKLEFLNEDLFWVAQLLDHLCKKDCKLYYHVLDFNIKVLQSDCPPEAKELTIVALVK